MTTPTHTPGPIAKSGTLWCRCTLDYDRNGIAAIVYCPTHAQAHAMLALVQQIADGHEPDPDAARAILRAVEG